MYGRMALQTLIGMFAGFYILRQGKDFLVLVFLIFIPCVTLALLSKNQYALHLFLLVSFCLCMVRDTEVYPVSRVLTNVWFGAFLGLVVNLLLNSFGYVDSKIFVVVTSGTIKSSLGFYNPNIAALTAAGALMVASCLRSKVMFVFSLLVFVYVYSQTYARTALFLIVIYYLCRVLSPLFDVRLKRILSCAVLVISLIVFFAISSTRLVPELARSNAFGYLDRILSGRFSVSLPYIEQSLIFLPSELKVNLDFAWATVLIVFGTVLISFTLLIFIISVVVMDKKLVGIYSLCVVISFSSLFAENIAYIYMPIGIFFGVPIAISINTIYAALTSRWSQNGLPTAVNR
ncbi:hypothetical protein QU617_18330 [Pseudomonas guariconensis]|uniref:hypothetical protein n=2 Tax=Pseudomonas guariconensis TaxID=1288410 RepID=UPI0018D99C45|nr:hypothetical protein [Pseudomonas guariconensis]MBH3359963.1 hypothetical protein [Pseudomonas guariconensis]MDM9595250.1 hypothetical protein [Pseudomonas guariconensis]MDM9613036.1 hypothetical protein [Pseudomonas guariconensis]